MYFAGGLFLAGSSMVMSAHQGLQFDLTGGRRFGWVLGASQTTLTTCPRSYSKRTSSITRSCWRARLIPRSALAFGNCWPRKRRSWRTITPIRPILKSRESARSVERTLVVAGPTTPMRWANDDALVRLRVDPAIRSATASKHQSVQRAASNHCKLKITTKWRDRNIFPY